MRTIVHRFPTEGESAMRSAARTAAAVVLTCVCVVQAVDIKTVRVGNPGNIGELSGEGAGGFGPDRLCGIVQYAYDIGMFEVTAGQYTEFLNAVAAEDIHGLYNSGMWGSSFACNIERTGLSPDYTYRVAPEWADRPVNFVSWGDAARFANWLHNGQPTGGQDSTTTEDGSYFLDGATDDTELLAVVRKPNATWVIPSEDEWYKAAYHKNDGATGNYFDYPTSSDGVPSNDLIDPDPGNNATFYGGGHTLGTPYWRTNVGAHENSPSPYGTYDQGGNLWEWNEAVIDGSVRDLRGGSFIGYYAYSLHASSRYLNNPTYETDFSGFRVANVSGNDPVPTVSGWGVVVMALLALAAGTLVLTQRRATIVR